MHESGDRVEKTKSRDNYRGVKKPAIAMDGVYAGFAGAKTCQLRISGFWPISMK